MLLEKIKNYFQELRKTAPYNYMIPFILGILGAVIVIRNRVKGY